MTGGFGDGVMHALSDWTVLPFTALDGTAPPRPVSIPSPIEFETSAATSDCCDWVRPCEPEGVGAMLLPPLHPASATMSTAAGTHEIPEERVIRFLLLSAGAARPGRNQSSRACARTTSGAAASLIRFSDFGALRLRRPKKRRETVPNSTRLSRILRRGRFARRLRRCRPKRRRARAARAAPAAYRHAMRLAWRRRALACRSDDMLPMPSPRVTPWMPPSHAERDDLGRPRPRRRSGACERR